MRRHPYLYEINACLYLRRLSRRYGHSLSLASIPVEEWRGLARLGFDLVWPMGVWRRSPGAPRPARQHPGLRQRYSQALPDWTEDDIGASPYAVYEYAVDEALGDRGELGRLKERLNGEGLGLIVDFVPNHVALDHPWVHSHPDWFVQGNRSQVRAHPDWFYSPDGKVYLSHGRDPYFPPWTDTAQVNFFSRGLREALTEVVLGIADIADGVRCDMAMLALNDIFEKVWGRFVTAPRPETEFWTEVISRVRQKRPDFIFLAEGYWGLEQRLLELGFNFVYDKVLYDRLRSGTPADIRRYIVGPAACPPALVRFIENHDEPRAVVAFGRERSLAAAVVIATLPGMRFFHDGQLEGKRISLPLQLIREPEEMPDVEVVQFYERLLEVCNSPAFHEGEWGMLEVGPAWSGNGSHDNLLVWSWRYSGEIKIVVVNYSQYRSQGQVRLPFIFRGGNQLTYLDELNMATYTIGSDELDSRGLYIELDPWRAHILSFKELS